MPLPFIWFEVPFLWPFPHCYFSGYTETRVATVKDPYGLHFGKRGVRIFSVLFLTRTVGRRILWTWNFSEQPLFCPPLIKAPAYHAFLPHPKALTALQAPSLLKSRTDSKASLACYSLYETVFKLPPWSSGWYSVLPRQGARVQSLDRELDPQAVSKSSHATTERPPRSRLCWRKSFLEAASSPTGFPRWRCW